MTNDEIMVERALRLSRFRAGFAHGADPSNSRRRVEGTLTSDPSWRAGFETGRRAADDAEMDFDFKGTLRLDLAVLRYPDRYKDMKPHAGVVDHAGKVVRHKFEEPHDEPSGTGPCWFCLRDRGDKVHTR